MVINLVSDDMNFVYKSCCYFSISVYPFGFCKKCWINQGKPTAMDGSTFRGSAYE